MCHFSPLVSPLTTGLFKCCCCWYFRNVQALIVLHEELMEEIYDWMEETEKQLDSIQVEENNVISLKEEFGQIKVLFPRGQHQ